MMLPIQCAKCRNYETRETCKAYQQGIPMVILTGEHDHTKPFKGDNGIRFEPIRGTK